MDYFPQGECKPLWLCVRLTVSAWSRLEVWFLSAAAAGDVRYQSDDAQISRVLLSGAHISSPHHLALMGLSPLPLIPQ